MKFLIIIPGIVLIGLLIYLFFHFLYLIIGGTKARSKYMKKQLENSKNLIEENEDLLKEVVKRRSEIYSGAIENSAAAIRRGFSSSKPTETIFCKHCGAGIDKDSKYCKSCGKLQ